MTRSTGWRLSLALILVLNLQTTAAQVPDATLYVSMAPPCFFVPTCPTEFLEIDTGVRAITGRWADIGGDMYATPDGRYLVGRTRQSGGPRLIGWNRLTRTLLPELSRILTPSWPHVLGHPSRLEAYEIDDSFHVIAVTPAGVRRLVVPAPCIPTAIRALSGDGRRLAIGCAGFMPVGTVVYDLDQQRVIREFPQQSAFPMAFSDDGTTIFMFTGLTTLRKFSVDSGDVLAERELPHAGWVYVDPYSARVFVAGDHRMTMPEDGTVVLDPDTLTTVATAVPELGTIWAFDPDRPLAYTLRSTFAAPGGYRTRLLAVDTETLTAIDVAELPSLFALSMTLVPRPSAPTNVTALVAGNRVQLSWAAGARGIPARYVVEVGSAPGLSNLAVFDVGLNTTVMFDPVPAGRYFVRVRVGNADGLGVPSMGVIVAVP